MKIGLLSVFMSLSFSLWVHIRYSDVIISMCFFFILFPILNIIMHEIESWVKAYDDVDIDCPSGLWCMENKTLPYDIEKIDDISFFEFKQCYYTNGSKNSRIKRLLSHCNKKSRETADVYIIEKSDKIYIEIDKF